MSETIGYWTAEELDRATRRAQDDYSSYRHAQYIAMLEERIARLEVFFGLVTQTASCTSSPTVTP